MKTKFSLFFFLFFSFQAYSQITFQELVCNDSGSARPESLVSFKGKTLFAAYNTKNGYELWETDGSQAGTKLLKDINPGPTSAYPSRFIEYNQFLYFLAFEPIQSCYNLWRTDGSTSGTTLVKVLPKNGVPGDHLIVYNGHLYFNAFGDNAVNELWQSDGTESGTKILKPYSVDGCNNPIHLTVYNSKLYFSAMNAKTGRELWVSDGTANGTNLLKEIYAGPIGSSPTQFIEFNGKLIFQAKDSAHGIELWETDGSANGTKLINDINPGKEDSNPYNFYPYKGQLIFNAYRPNEREELWLTDGTAGGTKLIKDINPAFASGPSEFTAFKDLIYFRASDAKGSELWVTDGTTAGTRLVKDLVTGTKGSNLWGLRVYHDKLYFSAISDINTYEYALFESDGTDTGTHVVEPLNKTYNQPIDYQQFYWGLKESNGKLFFSAWYTANKIQLWTLSSPKPNTEVNKLAWDALTVYPNPSSGVFTLNTNGNTCTIEVSNGLGKNIVSEFSSGTSNRIIDLSMYPSGVCFLSLRLSDGTVLHRMLVKE